MAVVTLEEAAAIPAAGLTALQALRDRAGVRPGQRVLINGAAGGVGTFSVQIARWLGAEVTGVTSTRNVELVRSLGAHHVVDYSTTDVTRSGERYDVILDNVGSPSLRALRRVLAPDGTLVLVGAPDGRVAAPLLRVAAARIVDRTTSQRLLGFLTHPVKEDLLTLKALVEAGHVQPIIDRRYPLAEIREAMRYLETMHARAKIVLSVQVPVTGAGGTPPGRAGSRGSA